MRKIFICPYFGDFPEWMGKYVKHAEKLKMYGYDFLIDTDIEGFKKRVKDKLGIDCPIIPGTGKVQDYRATFGVLYEEELKDYEWYGHVDFDMVFGDVDKWFPNSLLEQYDVISNHGTYICGPWTLYRNTDSVNNLFRDYPDWKEKLIYPESNGWVEQEYSRALEASGLRYKYMFAQGDPYHPPFNLKKVDGKLYQDGVEIAMLHFRRHKVWPLP